MFGGFFRNQCEFKHYGVARRSGRYPWGSGEEPTQGGPRTLSQRVEGLRRKGMSEKEAAAAVGMSIADVRAQRSLEKAQARAADVAQVATFRAKGMSTTAIAARMGKNESSIRSLENPQIQQRSQITKETADMLRRAVGEDKYVDVGMGIEAQLGISNSRLKTSVKMLENEGYVVHNVQVDQLGTDKKTTVKVVCPAGTTYKDVVTNKNRIVLPTEHSDDGGRSFLGVKPPVSISSKRIQVVYKEDGGSDRDGLIELRRGAPDLSLGTSRYAQVRIAVDGTHYLKGMALPVNTLPPGVDIRFHTSKPRGTAMGDTLKKMSDDPDNPFGSTIKQFDYTDASGKKQQSPLNIVGSDKSPNQEGRWAQWSRAISSQVLSKQPDSLAQQQLAIVVKQKRQEYDEISKLTNPAVKRRLLDSLADDCDSSSVHLKAAAMPRQMNHVLLPVVTMPDHQVYAPNYKNGESVVLIRHPHGGKFEIPELVVNNNHPEARRVLGTAKDAIGISPNVAKRLSGADFDGDHVLVIPNPSHGKNRIRTSPALDGLKDFDPQTKYPHVPGMPVMGLTKKAIAKAKAAGEKVEDSPGGNKQHAMGDISNLITDMTIKGASHEEIAAAVRHSMVVIDSEKHKLNYKQSELDNGILHLKAKYQGRGNAGASTLISKASSDATVPHRKEGALVGPPNKKTGLPTRLLIDPKTGEKLYTPTGESYIKVETNKKTGVETKKVIDRVSKISKMEKEKDAHALSSGTTMEQIYADHANALKAMANIARRDSVNTKNIPYSPDAKRQFSGEVNSLATKLKAANANKPLERRAQLLANDIVATKRRDNPHLSQEDIKKIKGQALTEARARVGAKKPAIIITPREWMAIQKGAVSPSFLDQVIQNADLDTVKALATPRPNVAVSKATSSRARTMEKSGYTQAQIAEQLGVSISTVQAMLNGG